MTHKLTPRKQQLASFYEAFNGNPDALDRILIPDWVSHEPNPGQGKGRQGLKDFIGAGSQVGARCEGNRRRHD
jgi:hypothetical protein